jgi:hypothetical protein
VILRGLLLLTGVVALTGSIAFDRPERFAVTAPCGLVAFVVGAGAIAADAVPLRRIPLVCSVLTTALGILLVLGRGETQLPAAAAIVVCQLAGFAAGRSGGRTRDGASRIAWPR